MLVLAGDDLGVCALPFWGGGGGGGGDLLMNVFSRERAVSTTWAASPNVRQVIIDEARTALQTRHALMVGMDQRIAQMAAALFAAGAFSLTIGYGMEAALTPLPQLAGLAGVAFLVGAIFCVVALRASDFIFPGCSPSWWSAAEFLGESDADGTALTWAAGNLEAAIEDCDRLVGKRARLFNIGLNYGIGGAVMVLLAGLGLLFR